MKAQCALGLLVAVVSVLPACVARSYVAVPDPSPRIVYVQQEPVREVVYVQDAPVYVRESPVYVRGASGYGDDDDAGRVVIRARQREREYAPQTIVGGRDTVAVDQRPSARPQQRKTTTTTTTSTRATPAPAQSHSRRR